MTSNEDARKICPYVGLQPFEEADREFFFGRERDQRIIIANLLASPLTILYGSSGVGKSSVLMAGVVPQLHRERPKTPVVVFRNWADRAFQSTLTRACIDAVWKNTVDQPKPAETLPFDEVLRACAEASRETVLVLLDQFEEYFLYHPKSSDPESFEVQFARAVNRDDVDAGFLIALRDDGLSKLDCFQERIPNLLSNRLQLKHLDTAEAAVAIRKPLDVWNDKYKASPPVSIEEDLISQLILQVRTGLVSAARHGGSGAALMNEGYIEAPFLQLVLVRLWEEEMHAGSSALRRETLDRLEGAREIVSTHLDDVMGSLEAMDQVVCASFFDRLVTPTGTKVACYAADLASWAGDLAPKVPAVLGLLSRSRILRTVAAAPDQPEATRYEIYHDVLAGAILDWRRRYVEDRERALAVEQAREQIREQARKQALRRRVAALTTMAVIAMVGWVSASWQRSRSEANQKAAESIYTAPFDAKSGLDLALEAVRTTPFGVSLTLAARLGLPPTAAAEDALRQAIQASRLQWTLPMGKQVLDIAFSPDGKRLAVAAWDMEKKEVEAHQDDKTVRILDIAPGYPQPGEIILQHPARVRAVSFLPAGDRLVTAADDTAYLWSLATPQDPLVSFVHGGSIYGALALNRDGTRLATAGNGTREGRLIKVWDLATPGSAVAPITTIDMEGAWVMGLSFSPDGYFLATACVELGRADQPSTRIWSIQAGREVLRMPYGEARDAVAFSPDRKWLVTAGRDALLRVWQPAGDTLQRVLEEKSASMLPGGKAPSAKGEEVLWSERIFAGHGERVRNVAVSPDGSRIASAGGDQTAKIWDSETGQDLLTLTGHKGFVEAVKFSPDGHHVATASRDKTVKFWNIEGHTNSINSIAFSPDGKMLATCSSDRTAKLWDLNDLTPRLRNTLKGHTDQVYELAFNPAGNLLATAGFDNTVRLWEVSSGTEIATLGRHKDQLRGVAFSPDGKHLAGVDADGFAWLYDLESPDIQGTALPAKHTDQVSAVAFHPKRDRWTTAGWDGKLRLWDFSGANIGVIELPDGEVKHSKRITDIAFSPNGKIMAALVSHWVYLWPVEAFEHSGTEPNAIVGIEGAGYCRALAYDLEGGQLAVACNDGMVRLYDTATNKLLKTITVHKNAVTDVAFSPDGTRLATASLDKTFHVSPLHFDELYKAANRRWNMISGYSP